MLRLPLVLLVLSLSFASFAAAQDASTGTPVSTPTPSELIAQTPQTSNLAWQPHITGREFEGVPMVLVPAGCFEMGEANEGGSQCFNVPFWMDKYEVTQDMFARLGGTKETWYGFSGDNLPVERISWGEANDFCALRGGRLPTEAEWEYAARGPDGLLYPWGNTFSADNGVFFENSNRRTAEVGSRAGGRSWVGALDLSGNVWEWTLSVYDDYPYVADDGREHLTSDAARVLRGSSWLSQRDSTPAASRIQYPPDSRYFDIGFRCIRPFSS